MDNSVVGIEDDLFHGLRTRVDEIEIFSGHTTFDSESQELFHNQRNLGVNLNSGSVTSNQGTEELETRNFNREVEGSDQCNGSVRPSVARGVLTLVITSNVEGTAQESGIITSKVFKESTSNSDFTLNLNITLGHDSLGELAEEGFNFRLFHFFSDLTADITVELVSVRVLDGVVQTRFGNFLGISDEFVDFSTLGVGDSQEFITIHRIDNSGVFTDSLPLTAD